MTVTDDSITDEWAAAQERFDRHDRIARHAHQARTVPVEVNEPPKASPHVPALVASTTTIDEPRAAYGGPKPTQWQIEAREGRGQIGEVRRGSSYIADFAKSIRWFPAVIVDGEPVPIDTTVKDEDGAAQPVLSPADQAVIQDSYDRLNDGYDGGMASLAAYAIENDLLVGEWYLIQIDWDDKPEEFRVVSIFELGWHQGQWIIASRNTKQIRDKSIVKLPAGTEPQRVWRPDPFYSDEADSPLKPLGTIMRQIIWQRLSTTARMRSSVFSGMFTWPVEADQPGAPGPDGKPGERPFSKAWLEWVQRGLDDPLSPLNAAPMLARAPEKFVNAGKFYSFGRPRGVDGPSAQELVRALLQAMDVPIELILGLGETSTFAAAGLIMQDRFDGHLAPKLSAHAVNISDAWLRRDLRARGASEELVAKAAVWYDASDKIADPERSKHANDAHAAMAISDAAYRHALGFDEGDAPTPEELLRRRALTSSTDGAITEALLLQLLETFRVQRGEIVTPGAIAITTEQGEVTGEEPVGEASDGLQASLIAATVGNPGTRINAIEGTVLARLTDLAQLVMARAAERIGARTFNRAKGQIRDQLTGVPPGEVPAVGGRAMVAAAGVDDEAVVAEEFDRERDTVAAILAAMLRDINRVIVNAAADHGDPIDADVVETAAETADEQSEAAADWWITAATVAAIDTLFTPGVAEGERAAGQFPASVGRQTITAASGAPLDSIGAPGEVSGEMPSVVENGSTAALVTAAGLIGVGHIWRWGGASTPFPPHFNLDDTTYTAANRTDVLANPSTFPPYPVFFPGDHRGCTCTSETVLVFREET